MKLLCMVVATSNGSLIVYSPVAPSLTTDSRVAGFEERDVEASEPRGVEVAKRVFMALAWRVVFRRARGRANVAVTAGVR